MNTLQHRGIDLYFCKRQTTVSHVSDINIHESSIGVVINLVFLAQNSVEPVSEESEEYLN